MILAKIIVCFSVLLGVVGILSDLCENIFSEE